jgi:thiamine-monophosphate kinase
MSVKGIGELAILERIKPYLATGATGDDASVIGEAGGIVVASCDMFVEGVHFDLGWMSAEDAGWRAVALSVGDLAAKGAQPAWALVSLALPTRWDVDRVARLYAGMKQLGDRVGLKIVGGDLSTIDGPAVLSLTVAGRASTIPLARAQAQPGWLVAVSGPLGAATVALRDRRALRLEPRIEEGRRLNELGICCGDVSDGLVREMQKFAAMSGAGCELDAGSVPCAPGASAEDALTSGEEAELVCVGPVEAIVASRLPVVGKMSEGGRVEVRGARVETAGYDHFG